MEEVNGRMVRLVLEPGTPWEDAFEGLDSLKSKMLVVKEEAEQKQREEDEKKALSVEPEVAALEVSA